LAHGTDPWGDTVGAPEIADGPTLSSSQFVPVDTGQTVGSRAERAVTNGAVHRYTGSTIRTDRKTRLAEVAPSASRAKDTIGNIAGGRHAALASGVQLMPYGTLGAS
jgi:hypothetical protein